MTSPERNLGLPDVIDGWFRARGWQPRPHQLALSATVQAGHDALLIAPTGGGKTLAGFLPSLTALQNKSQNPTGRPGIHTLYLSPLKALAVDVARNVEQPVMEMGLDIRIETRTGDTPVSKRNRQRQNPPDILLTTPEQLALLLAAGNAA
ncbi:MAG: DEAD/DEAH box helicase, partial [Henriciella sp.]